MKKFKWIKMERKKIINVKNYNHVIKIFIIGNINTGKSFLLYIILQNNLSYGIRREELNM